MDTTKQKPLLQHREEFEQILKDYKPNSETIEILQSTPLVSLVGPTASGRNTLIDILTSTGRYRTILSDTTRAPRVVNGYKEENGKVYWFKTEEEVLDGLKKGLYIEAAIIHNQQVSGANIYELEKVHKSGAYAIMEFEVKGAASYIKYKPNILIIFLLPPSFEVWMQRIKDRGGVDDEDLRRRLVSAEEEITAALNEDYYQFVINNEIHKAAKAVDELANGRETDENEQQKGLEHARHLLVDVQEYLKSN